MKPTKSILCHRSNSSSSPRAPLAASVPLTLSLSLSLLPSVPFSRAFSAPPSASFRSWHATLRSTPVTLSGPKLLSGYSRREFACVGVEFPPRASNYSSRDVHDQPRGNELPTGRLSRYSTVFPRFTVGSVFRLPRTDRACPALRCRFDCRMRPVSTRCSELVLAVLFLGVCSECLMKNSLRGRSGL